MQDLNAIHAKWNEIRASENPPRIRNTAFELGVSEETLLTADLGKNVNRLKSDWKTFIPRLGELGRVMALTRNDDVVHEVKGTYEHIELNQRHGLVLGPLIDLRIFPAAWHSLYSERRVTPKRRLTSFQVFDQHGAAVHKIYLLEDSNADAFDNLEADLASDDQSPCNPMPLEIEKPGYISRLNNAVNEDANAASFREDWSKLQDTHEFFGMLKKHKLARRHALRIAGPEWAQQVDTLAFSELLQTASKTQTPIMAFAGNHGCLQIFSGTVNKTAEWNGWFNIMDPDFNLHVKQEDLVECWLVRKPSRDGMIHSLEIFNSRGEMVLQLFGKRKPGIPELEAWRDILAQHFEMMEAEVDV